MPSVIYNLRQPGEPTDGRWFMDEAWNECSELQFTSLQDFKRRAHESICSIERLEVLATVSGRAAGIAVLAVDDDLHVGECLAVQWQYVLPEFRNAGVSPAFLRVAKNLARQLNLPTIAFTHRLGPGVYKTSYRRVYGQKDQKGSG